MSGQTPEKPTFPTPSTGWNIPEFPSPEELRKKAEEAGENLSPETKKTIDKTAHFIGYYQREIMVTLIGLVFLKLYKRRISKKAVRKVLKTLEAAGTNVSNGEVLPSLFDIVEELRATPGMAYIPHGGGMVHLLKGRDALITIFGDFDKMSTKEIWDQVANVLNLGISTSPR